MNDPKKTVLISTLYTQAHGGVYTMLSFLVDILQKMQYRVVIAYYMPYSVKPELSVPARKVYQKKPGVFHFRGELGVDEYAIGAFLPELEFTHYYPNQHWKKLINISSLHIVITGHVLSALPFYATKKKFLAWVATPYFEDRKDRIKLFPWYRKFLDYILISRVGAALEKRIIKKGTIVSLSHYAKHEFKSNEKLINDVISVPIDTKLFFSNTSKTQPGLICFTARFLDPRKNIDFLFFVFESILKKVGYAKLCLIGDDATPELMEKIDQLKIRSQVEILNYISRAELISKLQQTDVFFIPSYQEGLCISGLEAMACGCPVVSTKCGGPSDYIRDGENGYLVNFDIKECSDKIVKIIEDRVLRNMMSEKSIMIINKNYSVETVKNKWIQHIKNVEMENKLCR